MRLLLGIPSWDIVGTYKQPLETLFQPMLRCERVLPVEFMQVCDFAYGLHIYSRVFADCLGVADSMLVESNAR